MVLIYLVLERIYRVLAVGLIIKGATVCVLAIGVGVIRVDWVWIGVVFLVISQVVYRSGQLWMI